MSGAAQGHKGAGAAWKALDTGKVNGRARNLRPTLETLEDRLAPATLLHSLFPDPAGPQQGRTGSSVMKEKSTGMMEPRASTPQPAPLL